MRGKKLLSLLLAVTLACSMPLTACAANDATIEATSASLILAEASGYTDVPASAWYADAVEYVWEHGVMNGTGDGKFSPEATFTRAQFATVLYRIAGESAVTGEDAFGDTEAGQWYSDAVLWSAQQGIFQGYGDKFGTNDPVTQEQMVTVLWRYTGEPQPKETTVTDDASAYALDAIRWARGSGVIDEAAGYTFTAKQNATRALVAVILTAYLTASFEEEPPVGDTLTLSVGGTELDVAWEDNASVDALRELVRSAPLTVQMSMYGGFEQVGSLGTSLPRNDVQTTTDAGDIVLYSGSNIVIFYGSNSWAYTRLGKIQGMSAEELSALLGSGDVTVMLTIK